MLSTWLSHHGHTHAPVRIVPCTADGLKAISKYLSSLAFADEPDYDRLRAELNSMPDVFPALKNPQAYGQPSQTCSYAPTPAASPSMAPPSMSYPPAHPSHSSAPVQYSEAAWASSQVPQQYSYDLNGAQNGATWQQGCESNGYARGDPWGHVGDDRSTWDPAAVQHWPPHTQVGPVIVHFVCLVCQ